MQIETGTVISGKVTGITDFGAFVEFDEGKTGMVHISEVGVGFVKDIREHLKVGQEVKCKVLSVSPEGKISLSIKKYLLENENADEAKPQEQKKQLAKPRVWQGQKSAVSSEPQSFEDMMAHFKQISNDKMSDLKKNDSKRGSRGYSRRGNN